MSSKTSAYSAKNLVITLDGLKVRGLFDGDNAVQVDQGADVGSGLVGVLGDSIFSQSSDDSATVTLRLMHTSATHRQLVQKWEAQRAGRLVGFPLDHVDTGSNEGGTADQCFILRAPPVSQGDKATSRDWVLWTGDYKPNTPNL